MVEQDPNELPPEFVPSDNDVICGWARQNYHHAGNRMLRDLIQEYVPSYIKATTKTEKGHVILDIVERLRRESPTGVGLVRQNKKTGRWFYIGLEKAKDKIGHALRKASIEKHRSQPRDRRTPSKQQYASTDSLTSLSTSPSPTPVSSVSVPSSPSAAQQHHAVRYEDGAHAPYHPPYDEAYRGYPPHYHPGYAAYHHPHHPHYAPAPGHDSNYDGSAHHRGYEVYYPYPGVHGYPPAEYAYPVEAGSHPVMQHHVPYPPMQPPSSPVSSGVSPHQHHGSGPAEANFYSPVNRGHE